ncbi:MAG: hypothetical protein IKX40_07025 [Thermoguttaceae bacterium]|nr:hypothetical protein [Thermoguttaceae bacterium]
MSDQNLYPDPRNTPPELQEAWQAGYDERMKAEAYERGVKAAEEEIARKDQEAAEAKRKIEAEKKQRQMVDEVLKSIRDL